MFKEPNYERVVGLDRRTDVLLKHFAGFLKVKQFMEQWYPPGTLKTLEVNKIDDYNVDAKYANATVRFQLLITYNKDDGASGRVVCLHKHAVDDKVTYDYLGDFSFDANGFTSLPNHPQRGSRRMDTSLDEVVLAYLDQAIEKGPAWLSQAVQATAQSPQN